MPDGEEPPQGSGGGPGLLGKPSLRQDVGLGGEERPVPWGLGSGTGHKPVQGDGQGPDHVMRQC